MEFASDASFVERGRAAFAARAWADAYEALSRADRQTPLGADDLQRFALSAALLARDEQMLALLEREHDLRVADGELERAALCAFWIGFRSLFLGEAGRSNGWLERSAKLTGELGRPSVAEGFLLLPLALRNAAAGKLDDAVHVAERSVELAGRFGNLDLEALAQSVLGRAGAAGADRARTRAARSEHGHGVARLGHAHGHRRRLLRSHQQLRADLRARPSPRVDAGAFAVLRGAAATHHVQRDVPRALLGGAPGLGRLAGGRA